MNSTIRLYFLAVGIPALILAIGGLRLVHVENMRTNRPHPSALSPGTPSPYAGETIYANSPEKPPKGGWNRRMPPPNPKPRLPPRKHPPPGPKSYFGWIDATIIGLLFVSLVSGGWIMAQAAKRARLESLRQTDFISNISHEFKTPLTTICLCAELAQDDGLDPERRKKALRTIAGESEHLKRLVLNALDFSRLEKKRHTFRNEDFDLAVLARETADELLPRFATHGIIQPDGNCTVHADPQAARQILENLLDNAAKYAAYAGPVEIAVRTEGELGILTVSDHGPGLEKNGIKHVFDRFWRADNSITRECGGSGLGLSIARGLALGMKGSLTVHNRQDGSGAVFTLTLPVPTGKKEEA